MREARPVRAGLLLSAALGCGLGVVPAADVGAYEFGATPARRPCPIRAVDSAQPAPVSGR